MRKGNPFVGEWGEGVGGVPCLRCLFGLAALMPGTRNSLPALLPPLLLGINKTIHANYRLFNTKPFFNIALVK